MSLFLKLDKPHNLLSTLRRAALVFIASLYMPTKSLAEYPEIWAEIVEKGNGHLFLDDENDVFTSNYFARTRKTPQLTYFLGSHNYYGSSGSIPTSEFISNIRPRKTTKVIYLEVCNGAEYAPDIARRTKVPTIGANQTLYIQPGSGGRAGKISVSADFGEPLDDKAFSIYYPDGRSRYLKGSAVVNLFKKVRYAPTVLNSRGATATLEAPAIELLQPKVATTINLRSLGNLPSRLRVPQLNGAGATALELGFGIIAEPLNDYTKSPCDSSMTNMEKNWARKGILDKLIGSGPWDMIDNWGYALGLRDDHTNFELYMEQKVNELRAPWRRPRYGSPEYIRERLENYPEGGYFR